MGEKFPRLSASQVESVLAQNGFVLISQRGSHRKWIHPEPHRTVIVPQHAGRPLPIGTLVQIVRTSGIDRDQWLP